MTQQLYKKKVKSAFDRVFNSKDGEIVLAEISGLVMNDLVTYEPDVHKLYYTQGQKSVVNMILNMLNTDISEYIKEYKNIQKQEYNL